MTVISLALKLVILQVNVQTYQRMLLNITPVVEVIFSHVSQTLPKPLTVSITRNYLTNCLTMVVIAV